MKIVLAVVTVGLALLGVGVLMFDEKPVAVPPKVVEPESRVPLAAAPPPAGMVFVPGGEFTMGSDQGTDWPEERPAHRVWVESFFLDETEVTNEQFSRFVAATGYVTTAEKPWTVKTTNQTFPAGAMVFDRPGVTVDLRDSTRWWKFVEGACWNRPEGPNSNLNGKANYPVVHVSWDDASAYATWAGKRLPTEAEWERAARGGLDEKTYSWGDEPPGAGTIWRANTWQGNFPNRNNCDDGYELAAPVKTYPPNGYGLYDMAGNVWEWCNDWYQADLYWTRAGKGVIVNPTGPDEPKHLLEGVERMRSHRGGSFLCHDSYCSRYRVSARHGNTPDTGTAHTGFRCAKSVVK